MKKLGIILLSFILVFSTMVSCTNETKEENENSSKETGSFKIGLTMSSRDQFLSTLETAVKDSAADLGDVDIVAFDSENDVQKQLSHISSFVEQDVSAIIVNLVNTDTTEEIITAAKGKPVVFVNRMPQKEAIEKYDNASYVGSDESEAGSLQAEFLSEYFSKKDVKEIKYVLFMGTLGLQNTNARTDSVKSKLEEEGFKLKKQFEDTAEFDRAIAMTKMQQFIGSGKKFDVVISNNDEMALGAIEAMKSAKITDIPVVGIDATDNALVAVESGDMACSIFQDAKGQGDGALAMAYAYTTSKETTKYDWIPFKLVTKENVADFK
ncbi:MAG: substrate-binding domain-containing protein [Clostridiales bacterium]